ncbi:RICIN domain-containing protein [Streptomyces sp. AHU1]|uniref:RICIN domain-containing protein n=1 Tax=Streptomyces sp. AHU1 TaxID=3377215 RepID=UPI00387797CE
MPAAAPRRTERPPSSTPATCPPRGELDEDQQWLFILVPGATATYTIRNIAGNRCLAIGGASHTTGAKAIEWTCNGGTEQQWIYGSAYRLRNKESNLCLAIPSASQSNAIEAIQWTCEDVSTNPEQKWNLW